MSQISNAITAALSAAGKIAGGTITYTNGDDEVEIENVPFGRTDYLAEGENGITKIVGFDFHIPTAELDFGSGAVKPRRNNTIETSINGSTRLFQVLEINGVCYSQDPHGVKLRVHTKEVT